MKNVNWTVLGSVGSRSRHNLENIYQVKLKLDLRRVTGWFNFNPPPLIPYRKQNLTLI